jgi:hypothetical protein
MDVYTANIILKVAYNIQSRRKDCLKVVGETGVQIAEKILREEHDFNLNKAPFGRIFLELCTLFGCD